MNTFFLTLKRYFQYFSLSGLLKKRPISPHLSIYKFGINMLISISHRITGVIPMIIISIVALCAILSLILALDIVSFYSVSIFFYLAFLSIIALSLLHLNLSLFKSLYNVIIFFKKKITIDKSFYFVRKMMLFPRTIDNPLAKGLNPLHNPHFFHLYYHKKKHRKAVKIGENYTFLFKTILPSVLRRTGSDSANLHTGVGPFVFSTGKRLYLMCNMIKALEPKVRGQLFDLHTQIEPKELQNIFGKKNWIIKTNFNYLNEYNQNVNFLEKTTYALMTSYIKFCGFNRAYYYSNYSNRYHYKFETFFTNTAYKKLGPIQKVLWLLSMHPSYLHETLKNVYYANLTRYHIDQHKRFFPKTAPGMETVTYYRRRSRHHYKYQDYFFVMPVYRGRSLQKWINTYFFGKVEETKELNFLNLFKEHHSTVKSSTALYRKKKKSNVLLINSSLYSHIKIFKLNVYDTYRQKRTHLSPKIDKKTLKDLYPYDFLSDDNMTLRNESYYNERIDLDSDNTLFTKPKKEKYQLNSISKDLPLFAKDGINAALPILKERLVLNKLQKIVMEKAKLMFDKNAESPYYYTVYLLYYYKYYKEKGENLLLDILKRKDPDLGVYNYIEASYIYNNKYDYFRTYKEFFDPKVDEVGQQIIQKVEKRLNNLKNRKKYKFFLFNWILPFNFDLALFEECVFNYVYIRLIYYRFFDKNLKYSTKPHEFVKLYESWNPFNQAYRLSLSRFSFDRSNYYFYEYWWMLVWDWIRYKVYMTPLKSVNEKYPSLFPKRWHASERLCMYLMSELVPNYVKKDLYVSYIIDYWKKPKEKKEKINMNKRRSKKEMKLLEENKNKVVKDIYPFHLNKSNFTLKLASMINFRQLTVPQYLLKIIIALFSISIFFAALGTFYLLLL